VDQTRRGEEDGFSDCKRQEQVSRAGPFSRKIFNHEVHEEHEGEEGREYEFIFEMSLLCDIDGKGELGRARYQ